MTQRDTVIAALGFLEREYQRQADMVQGLNEISEAQFGLTPREMEDLAACVKDRDQLRAAIATICEYMDLPRPATTFQNSENQTIK